MKGGRPKGQSRRVQKFNQRLTPTVLLVHLAVNLLSLLYFQDRSGLPSGVNGQYASIFC